jgi:ABC-2 type transport system permease protein
LNDKKKQIICDDKKRSAHMQSFTAMLIASVKMVMRSRITIVASLGLAIISIFIFGWLFGDNSAIKLSIGVVNNDNSPAGTQIIQSLQKNDALVVDVGSQQREIDELKNGNRNAVLVMGNDFGSAMQMGQAQLTVYLNQSDITTLAVTRTAMQQIVDNINLNATGKTPAVTIQEQSVSTHNLRQIDYLTPGMIGMMLMWANMTVGIVLVIWRQQGVMKRLAVTPIRPVTLVGSQMLARLIVSIAQAAILLIIAKLAFNVQVTGSWLALGLVIVVGALAMLSLGFLIGGFITNQDAAQPVVQLISFPMMFLSGSYFPTSGAPDFLQPVIKALPLTHLNDALRTVMNNGGTLATVQNDLLILLAWIVAGVLLSMRTFRWS